MRALLNDYNSLLARVSITLAGIDGKNEWCIGEADDGSIRYVKFDDGFTYPTFNQGSFEVGGRFYGGWWQQLSKPERKSILIDGQETVELNFSGMLPSLLYAEADVDYWSEINIDPYILDNVSPPLAKIATREFCKTLFMAAINAASEQKAMKSVLAKGLTLSTTKSILSLLKEKHHPIAGMFGSGIGAKMMNREAQITEKIIEHFTQQGIPILTIHDGYIVAEQHKTELMDQMRSAFRTVAGVVGIRIH